MQISTNLKTTDTQIIRRLKGVKLIFSLEKKNTEEGALGKIQLKMLQVFRLSKRRAIASIQTKKNWESMTKDSREARRAKGGPAIRATLIFKIMVETADLQLPKRKMKRTTKN